MVFRCVYTQMLDCSFFQKMPNRHQQTDARTPNAKRQKQTITNNHTVPNIAFLRDWMCNEICKSDGHLRGYHLVTMKAILKKAVRSNADGVDPEEYLFVIVMALVIRVDFENSSKP